MTHNGKIASLNVSTYSIRAPGHECVLMAMLMLAVQGVLRAGTIIAKNSDDKGVPYEDLSETLGTGDGSTKTFTGTMADAPLEPGSVAVTDGTESFEDDGFGNLIGSDGGSGTMIYKTGSASVTFNAAVANGTDITITAGREIAGVLDRDVDTDKAVDGAVVVHGTVKEDALLKGADAAGCETADFVRLRGRHIYPV